MPIVKRTYNDIVRDGKKRLRDYTNLNNFNEQGIVNGLVDMFGIEGENWYDNLDYIYRSSDPTRAVGADLNKNGFLVGESRRAAVVATDFTFTNFHFYIDPRLGWGIQQLIEQNYSIGEIDVLEQNGYITKNGNTIESLIIPQGTIVSNTNGTINYTTSTETLLVAKNPAYAPIVANSVGSDYNVSSNVLINHSIRNVADLRKIAHYIKCKNTFPIQNGSYTQTDEEYRYNIAISRASRPTNEINIRRTALSVPGVRDIMFERHKYGNGTVSIIIDGTTPLVSTALIQAVTERVNQVVDGDKIYVSAPEYLGVELTFYIETDPGIENDGFLRQSAKDAIIQYINDLPIGGEIVWNQIVSDVIEIDGIRDFYPNVFKYGEYNPVTKINSKQVILRFMNQKALYNQKFYCDSGLIICCS